jgi:hypothetical protein
VPAQPPLPSSPIAPAKSLTEALTACNKLSEGPFTLPGADGDIQLNSCYRGTDHLNCEIDALVAEAKAINQSYKEIADPKYADVSNIDAICRIEPGILAEHLKRAKSFDARWDLLSAQYGKLADCSNLVEDSIRNVVLPDMPRGGDIVKSMIDKIRGTIRRVSESQSSGASIVSSNSAPHRDPVRKNRQSLPLDYASQPQSSGSKLSTRPSYFPAQNWWFHEL